MNRNQLIFFLSKNKLVGQNNNNNNNNNTMIVVLIIVILIIIITIIRSTIIPMKSRPRTGDIKITEGKISK